MQTVRRLYLYAVSIVSLEVVLWGSIGLARSIFAAGEVGAEASRLAGALALILVGIPVFLIHWWLAQRFASSEVEERSARTRAVFLYGGLLATLVPCVQNLLALAARSLNNALGFFGLRLATGILGERQSTSDNLIAIALNLLVAVYLYTVTRRDWHTGPQGDAFPETRRLYRYLWLLYGLGLTLFGVQQVLQYLLSFWTVVGAGLRSALANGLALTVVGTPLWAFTWLRIRNTWGQAAERESVLRLVVLYLLVFVSAGFVLIPLSLVLYSLLRFALGEARPLGELWGEISTPLSISLVFGGVWLYYGGILRQVIQTYATISGSAERYAAALRRLYLYVLALFALGATFFGLHQLLATLVDLSLGTTATLGGALRNTLSAGLSALIVGLPLWLLTWRPAQREAASEGEMGDHARRSLVRKSYLYLALFVGVMGVMFSAGALLYQLLRALLGEPLPDLRLQAWQLLKTTLLFGLLLGYHWLALRSDQRLAQRSLARRYAQFPLLILAPPDEGFAAYILQALEREAREMPVAVHPYALGAPDETLSSAKAVILPAELLIRPPEAVRLWLQNFTGMRLVVPTPQGGWHWLGSGAQSPPELARWAARAARQLAEGEEISAPRQTSPWLIVLYILAGIIALPILVNLIRVLFASL